MVLWWSVCVVGTALKLSLLLSCAQPLLYNYVRILLTTQSTKNMVVQKINLRARLRVFCHFQPFSTTQHAVRRA